MFRAPLRLLFLIFVFTALAVSTSAMTASGIPTLDLPWPCDTTYRISQGHDTGSHKGKGKWAWDVHISKGSVLTAPADGVVRMVRDDSTRFGCDPKYAWDANYVVLDFGTGYEALFLHLKAGSARVRAGQSVRAGEPIGEVGNSGWVCGTHLHFQIQETCSSWWCTSVEASFANVADSSRNARLTSQNCRQEQQVACTVPTRGDRIIDERDDCYRRTEARWRERFGGHDGRYDYTFATSNPDNAPTASWNFEVQTPGRYNLEVYIPREATSRRARYFINTG
ncbi:MAG: M23 family metallopeptidase, partial [Bradymonadaceae bacterium]